MISLSVPELFQGYSRWCEAISSPCPAAAGKLSENGRIVFPEMTKELSENDRKKGTRAVPVPFYISYLQYLLSGFLSRSLFISDMPEDQITIKSQSNLDQAKLDIEVSGNFLSVQAMYRAGLSEGFHLRSGAADTAHAAVHQKEGCIGILFDDVGNQHIAGNGFFIQCCVFHH